MGAGSALAPIRCLEGLFVRCIADVVGETLIVDASRQNHAPDAEGSKDKSLLVCPSSVQVSLEQMDHGLGNVPVGGLDGWATASDVGWNPDQRTRTIDVV
jgi:hypothetical protein